jgi:hypothetical protein
MTDGVSPYDLLKINTLVFDEDGRVRAISHEDWNDEWVTLERRHQEPGTPEGASSLWVDDNEADKADVEDD